MNTRYIVSGIIQKENKILLGKKSAGRPPYPDAWHLPGGGVENMVLAEELVKKGDLDNSLFREELKREIKEETGLDVKNIKNIVPQFRQEVRQAETPNKHNELTHYFFLEYLCDYESGQSQVGDDFAQIEWFDIPELKNTSLTPPSQEMFRELGWIK